ncbi:helix-turn-helix domain-containing protein [Arsenophonus nasoniae]|uniref:helix-turn-helix domain-containing protein n=1 Tax=Arsenophonus nasoniae TaxID=638 RepID=UPI0038790A16
MHTMSTDYSEKLLAIRKAEGLTQQRFASITGISLSTIKNYETGQRPARSEVMERVARTTMFSKYAMWLLLDEIAPSAGQIAPALAHCGTNGGEAQKQRRKTGENSDVRSSHYDQKTG